MESSNNAKIQRTAIKTKEDKRISRYEFLKKVCFNNKQLRY